MENPRSIIVTLIVINVVVFLASILFYSRTTAGANRSDLIVEWLAVYGQTLMQPWMWWQFLTYGFVHDTQEISHLLFNMLGCTSSAGTSNTAWDGWSFCVSTWSRSLRRHRRSITSLLLGKLGPTIGASGAVIATAILFACYFPNREILLMLVVSHEGMGVGGLSRDRRPGRCHVRGGWNGFSNTAFTVHLAGAFFALGYLLSQLEPPMVGPGGDRRTARTLASAFPANEVKAADPEKKLEREAEEADRILAKIHQFGESSLTSSERKTLERYSRRQREKRDR